MHGVDRYGGAVSSFPHGHWNTGPGCSQPQGFLVERMKARQTLPESLNFQARDILSDRIAGHRHAQATTTRSEDDDERAHLHAVIEVD
jgi:hypothetical protein